MKFPKYLSIQTTSMCNSNCIFCPYPEIKNMFPKKIMDEGLFVKIIEECSNYREIKNIVLCMNNEPLTDPYLIERINYTKKKVPWASVRILTNGSLLSEEKAERLINSKLDKIGISFHGINKDTIQNAMGIPYKTSIERISKFINKVKEKKNMEKYMWITFLKHKYLTEKEKEKTINFWKEKGVKRIDYFDSPISRAGNVKSLPKVYHKEKVIGCNSIWSDSMIHIVENGKVVLCCMDWRREVILGDLNKESIYQVWNGKRKEIWEMIYGRKEMPRDFLCKKCESAVLENKKETYNVPVRISNPKILLVIAPCWGVDRPPLALASISSYLKNKGIGVEVLDLNIEIYNHLPVKLKRLWDMDNFYLWEDYDLFYEKIFTLLNLEIKWAAEKIINSDIDIIGFSIYDSNRFFSKEIIKEVKNNCKKTIILGGRGVYDVEGQTKYPKGLVDYFVVGEGEEVLYKFLKDGGMKNDGNFISNSYKNTPPILLKDLTNYPTVTYEGFDLSKYREKALSLFMSRGCIFQCAFCNDWRYVGRLRMRKIENVYREISYHFHKNNIKKFYFNDQAINLNLKKLEKLCYLLEKAPFDIEWIALAVPWKFLTLDLLRKMKKAGCITLNYGIESGSDRIIKLMNKINKKCSIKEIEEILQDTRKAGIDTQLNFIVGFPGETREDYKETKKFIKRNLKNISGITSLNMCDITRGSDLMVYRNKYKVILPKKVDKNDNVYWFTRDMKNTYEIRLQRVKGILNLAREYELPVWTTNLPSVYKNEFYYVYPFEKFKKIFFYFFTLLFLGLTTFLFDLYIWTLKKLKKIIVFPGT